MRRTSGPLTHEQFIDALRRCLRELSHRRIRAIFRTAHRTTHTAQRTPHTPLPTAHYKKNTPATHTAPHSAERTLRVALR